MKDRRTTRSRDPSYRAHIAAINCRIMNPVFKTGTPRDSQWKNGFIRQKSAIHFLQCASTRDNDYNLSVYVLYTRLKIDFDIVKARIEYYSNNLQPAILTMTMENSFSKKVQRLAILPLS